MNQFSTVERQSPSAEPTARTAKTPVLWRQVRHLGIALLAVTVFTGCAVCGPLFGWRQLPPPGPRPSAVVLDFDQAPRVVERRDTCRNLVLGDKEVETERDRRGWWFGSQDVYYNANWGIIFADMMADKLRDEHVFEIRARSDVKYYYADKRELLETNLNLTDEKELDRALLALNPVSVGREMEVQKVVVGQIVDAEVRFDRTVGYYCAVASVNVSVYDAATGVREYSQNMSDTRGHSTVYGLLNKMADGFVTQMKQHYGAQMAPRFNDRPSASAGRGR